MNSIIYNKDISKQLLRIWLIIHAILFLIDIIVLLLKIKIMPINLFGIIFFHVFIPGYGLFLEARFSRYVEANYPDVFIRCSSTFQVDIYGNRRLKKDAKELKELNDPIIKTYLKNSKDALVIVILNFFLLIPMIFIHYFWLVPFFTKLLF